MIAQRRDNNEDDIVAGIFARGWDSLKMDKNDGFDRLVITPTGNRIVEIKNPSRKWELTPAEKKCKERVEKAGGTYNIVLYPEDLDRIK